MKKKLTIIGIFVAVCFVALLGIRIYGAFQMEQESAIARADEAEQEAKALNAKSDEDTRRMECDNQWLKYKNNLLDKQIAELKGGIGHTPIEPSCDGYAMSLDEGMKVSMEGMQAIVDASNAREYARLEREYSTNRKLQARFLALRLWTFLKGSELKPMLQATMQQDADKKSQNSKRTH